jgi:Ca2+-binding RTX toxin-like protein
MPAALGLALLTCHCGVGGVGQTTASPVQPTSASQQPASATTTGADTAGNTTGAVDPSATSTTGDAGTTTAAGASTTAATTAGAATAGATTGGTTAAGTTTGGDGNTTTGQNGNATLFDISELQQSCCYYDAQKGAFALSLSNDAQYCAHATSGVRQMQDHDLAFTAELNQKGASDNANDTTLLQPKSASATLSLYSATCTLQSQAKSVTASVTLTQANSAGCTGSFTVTMTQTMPSLSLTPVVLTGSFTAAPTCAALATNAARTKCQ